jgi:hypothetical protein
MDNVTGLDTERFNVNSVLSKYRYCSCFITYEILITLFSRRLSLQTEFRKVNIRVISDKDNQVIDPDPAAPSPPGTTLIAGSRGKSTISQKRKPKTI